MALPSLEDMQVQHVAAQLNALHAELIDDDRLEEWPDLFEDKCRYSVISAENHNRSLNLAAVFCDSRGMLVDRVVSLRRANIFPAHAYRHILGPTRVVSSNEQIISAQTNYVVLMTRNDARPRSTIPENTSMRSTFPVMRRALFPRPRYSIRTSSIR